VTEGQAHVLTPGLNPGVRRTRLQRIEFAEQLPKNASGKLLKRELRTSVRAPWTPGA
jgi:acyl-coenzyme A synthetase/AMP-(fatty) acid ligase